MIQLPSKHMRLLGDILDLNCEFDPLLLSVSHVCTLSCPSAFHHGMMQHASSCQMRPQS